MIIDDAEDLAASVAWLLELEGYIACFELTAVAGLEPAFRSSADARRVRRATFSLKRRISSSRCSRERYASWGARVNSEAGGAQVRANATPGTQTLTLRRAVATPWPAVLVSRHPMAHLFHPLLDGNGSTGRPSSSSRQQHRGSAGEA